MTIESIVTIGLAVLAIVFAPVLYIWKLLLVRIDKIEASLETKISKEELNNKLDPMRDDLVETKMMITKLLDLELNKKT